MAAPQGECADDAAGTLALFGTRLDGQEIFIDPVALELRVLNIHCGWRLKERLYHHPRTGLTGQLPAVIVGQSVCTRPDASDLRMLASAGLAVPPSHPESEAFRSWLHHELGSAIEDLLFRDKAVFRQFTLRVLASSVSNYAELVHSSFCFTERPRFAVSSTSLLCTVRRVLDTASERLGVMRYFGADETFDCADAAAFAHLAVLLSIPFERGSPMAVLLQQYPSLRRYCERIREEFLVWDKEKYWMSAVVSQSDGFVALRSPSWQKSRVPPGQVVLWVAVTAAAVVAFVVTGKTPLKPPG
mmetsp:Transcript_21667/g.46375  ORF Transcript_21667/g.46375 Transcript_21667/m.46375 type:complete len:301 (-) Transcript_21667:129-1031(-)